MILINVLYVVLLVSASVLCITLVFFLGRTFNTVKEIEIEIKYLTLEMKPLIASATNLSEKLNRLSESADHQLLVTRGIVSKVNNRVDTILDLEEKIRRGLEGPVMDFIKGFSAIADGISAFWNAYRKR